MRRIFAERYNDLLLSFFLWRQETFPRFYRWRGNRRFRKDMFEKFGFVPVAGDLVEDCRGEVHRIESVFQSDPDSVVLDDGFTCSLWHCCSLPKL